MIEINLLPEHIREKSKKSFFQADKIVFVAAGCFGLLAILHIVLFFLSSTDRQIYISLNKQWGELEGQRKTLAAAKNEQGLFSQDDIAMQQLLESRLSWAQKLNFLSVSLPAGVWFNEISISGKDVILKCSVVSLSKQELTLINKFINGLKQDQDFFKDFNSLELGPMQRQTLGGIGIINFVLNVTLK